VFLNQLVIKATDLDAAAMFVAGNLDSSLYESATVTLTLRPKGYAKYKEARRQQRIALRRERELQRLQVGQRKMAENLGIPVQAFLDAHANPGGPTLTPGAVNTLGTGNQERIDITPKGRRAVDDMPIGDFWSSGHAG
jgi:hypothetical protein